MVSQLDFYSWKLRDGRLLQADKCYCWGKKQLWLENARPQDIESWPGLAASCLSIVWWLGLLYTSRAPNGGNFLNIFSSDDHRVGTINLIPSRLIINTWFEAWKVFMPFGFRNNYWQEHSMYTFPRSHLFRCNIGAYKRTCLSLTWPLYINVYCIVRLDILLPSKSSDTKHCR